MISLMEDRFSEVLNEGLNFFELGKYDDCIELLSEAIAYARLLNRDEYMIKLMLKRADCYYHKGSYKRVLKHCKRVEEYIDHLSAEDLIDFHEMQAISYAQLGHYDQSIEEYQKLIEVPTSRAQFKAYVGLGLVYYHQARYHDQTEKYNTALFYYEKSLKQKGMDQRNMTMVLHNIGMVYYEKGLYQKALSRYFESLRYNVSDYLPYTYNELAKVYIRLEELEKASEYIDKAAVILAEGEHKDHIEIARNFYVKALYYKATHEYDTAIFFFKLALNELKDKEIMVEIAEIYEELAHTFKNIDEDRSIDYMAESRLYFNMLK